MFGLSHTVEVGMGVASVVMFVGTLLVIPFFLVHVPRDYFARLRPKRSLPIRLLRIALGLVLVGFGIAMLVLPGQGLLTILVGLSILEVPLKDRIIHRILSSPKVRQAVDELRRRAGKDPLVLPEDPGATSAVAS